MKAPNPNFEWYAAQSDKANVPKRCPFASASRCPRYYESLYLLGKEGITTEISEQEKDKLNQKWKGFESTIGEEAASIFGGKRKCMSKFCPEVSYKIFGLFASGLYPHADEIDTGLAHERLGREGADLSHPGWQWSAVEPCHYTECPEYSILQHAASMQSNEKDKQSSTSHQTFNIGAVHGAVGNISNSQVTVYDYSSLHQLLVDHEIPKPFRRELEDILDELKEAALERKPSLIARGEQWITTEEGWQTQRRWLDSKSKELLGLLSATDAETAKVFHLAEQYKRADALRRNGDEAGALKIFEEIRATLKIESGM